MAHKPRSNRWSGWLKRKPSVLRPFPSSLRFEELERRDVPATFSWFGAGLTPQGAPDPNWSNPSNWLPALAPTGVGAAAEDLVFPEGPTVRTTVNDIVGGFFNSLSFSTVPNAGYTLQGNSITLGRLGLPGTGFITVSQSSSGNDIQFDMTLGSGPANQFFTVDGGLTVSGKLSGNSTSTLTKQGIGTLALTADNSGYQGNITVNSDSGILAITNANALGTTNVGTTVGTNSTLQVSNVAGTINEPILLNGPGSNSAGALFNAAGNNTWNGPIRLGTGSATAGVVMGAAPGTVLTITSVISDTGAGQILSKEGAGEIQLYAANTYRGLTYVNSGVLTVGNKDALGAGVDPSSDTADPAKGTIVTSTIAKQGQLRLADPTGVGFTIRDEFLTLNGAGQAGLPNRGSLTNTNAENTWAGPVVLGSPTPNGVPVTIGTGGGTLTISGVISTPNGAGSPNGSSSLTKVDSGKLIFNNKNTYACPTFIVQGTLDIRDSMALGTNAVTVSFGATLQMDVEAGAGPNGSALPNLDAHGRNLSNDSVTTDAHRLTVSNPLTLNGFGVLDAAGTAVGALYSATGINIWTSTITITNAAIGVALDPRTGHPSPDSSYFVNDYSLTTISAIQDFDGTIGAGIFHKVGLGQIILQVANTYTGRTFIEAGWATVQNNRALGSHIFGLAATRQPETFVSTGAALHLRTLTPESPPLYLDENLILSGTGPLLPYRFISQKGALVSIGGSNVVGQDNALAPIWFGYVAYNGLTGVGVEQVAPLAPGARQDPSHLTIVGMLRDDNVTNPALPVLGGLIKLGSRELTLDGDATYSLATDIREGKVRVHNNTALGQTSTGTFAGPQVYNPTTTTVQSGANLLLDQSVPIFNGGVGSGIQVANEQLILNSAGQQVSVAGSLVPAPTKFFLSFKNNLIGQSEITGPLVPGLTGAEMAVELNKLPSIKGSEVQTVQVGPVGTFSLTFNLQTTVPAIPAGAPAATVRAALLTLSTIRRNEIQTVDVLAASIGFTLSFNGQTTNVIPAGSLPATVKASLEALSNIGLGNTTVTSSVIPGGTRYTVTFSGGAVAFTNVPQMTATGSLLPNPIVTTTQQGLGGDVTVTSAPGVPSGTLYTITFGGDLAFQNLNQLSAAGTAISGTPVVTVRDGINASVSVSDGLTAGPAGGNTYTISYLGDLANQDVNQIVASANDGTVPTTATTVVGGAANEVQTVKVVASTGSYTLTYTSPSDPLKTTHPGATATTVALPITAPSVQVQSALNALAILQDDVGSVAVSRSGNVYTIVFGTAHSTDTPLLIATSIFSPLGTPEVTVSGATTVDGYASEASLVSLTQDNAWRGPVVLNSGTRVATAANTRINFLGAISDATNLLSTSDLVKRGQGEVLLAGLNSFRGNTWIDEGITTAANSGAFGGTAKGTTVASNAQLQIQGSLIIAGEPLTVLGTGVPLASTVSDQWFNVGPASTNRVFTAGNQSTSGRVTSIATDPTDPNVIYIATAGGGAWKTKDKGLSWVPLFDDTVDAAAVIYGGSIYVAPSDPNVVYFATGEANGGGANGSPITGQPDSFAGTGIYKTNNAGASWTLVTGPNSRNPLFGLAVSKLIVDPTDSGRIYVATGNASVINGIPLQVATNILANAVAGVYRYDAGAATPDWVNLTGLASPNRSSRVGGAPYDLAPPGIAGPDDDYRIHFPQTNATWSDIALVQVGPGFGAKDGPPGFPDNTINGPGNTRHTWVLYAALGESQQAYVTGLFNVGGVFNAVYRTEDPANAFAAGQGPTWWFGTGTIYPVAFPNTTEAPSDQAIPIPTAPDGRPGAHYEVGPLTPPNPFHQPGRNEWIKLSAVTTRYYNVVPGTVNGNLLPSGLSMNASVRVYSTNLGNSRDYWPYPGGRNFPYGRTGEFLDIQRTGWDGGIATAWDFGITGPTPSPYGLTTANSAATGRYTNVIKSPDRTFGSAYGAAAPTSTGVAPTPTVNNSILYLAGKDDIWQTTNGLAAAPTWTLVTGGANTPADYFHALSIDTSTGNLLTGSDGGLWYDTISGNAHSFTNLNGNLATTQFNNVDPYPTDFNQALAASYNNGLQQFGGSLAWNGLTLPASGDRSRDAGDVRYDPKNPLTAFASSGGNLFRTQDGGSTWTQVLTASASNSLPVYVDPLNTSRVLVGGSAILETTQAGAASGVLGSTFVDLNGGTTTAIAAASYQGKFRSDPSFPLVTDLLSNTYDPDTIYISDGATLRVTKNRGVTWVSRPPFSDILYTVTFGGAFANGNVPQVTATPASVLTVTLLNGGVAGSEVQTIETFVNAGTFTLTFQGQTTAPIPFGATSVQVANALNALSTIGGVGGRVSVLAGPGGTAITDVAVDPSNRDTVYVTVRSTKGQLGLPSLFRSNDAGQTWADISGHSSVNAPVSYTNTTDVVVPDGTSVVVSSPITVTPPAGEVVTNVTVTLNISMTWDADLTIRLRGPNGLVVPLITRRGSNGDDFTDTTLDDAASQPIGGGVAPFTGSFKPESPLSAFVGIDPIGATGGVWTLELFDSAGADIATLRDWTLNLSTGIAVAGALPNTQTWTAVVDPRTDTLYVGNDQGVWQLKNASGTPVPNWVRFGAGMPNVQVHDLVLNQTLNTLTAATYGRGLYQLLLTDYQDSPGAVRVISGNSVWTGAVTIAGNTTITADGTQAIQNGIAAASLDFIGPIGDSTPGNNSTIIKSGLGTITFSGSNTYGGQTLIQQGVLKANNPTALGLATANTVVSAGAALALSSDLQAEPVLLNGNGFFFNGHNTGGFRNVANNNVYTGKLTLGTNATIGVDSGTTLTIGADPKTLFPLIGTGTIDDLNNNFTLDKELAGTLVLASANTYGGETRVNQGALRVEDPLALGSAGPFSGTRVLDGAQVQISRNAKTLVPTVVTSESLFLSGTGLDITGALRNVRGDLVQTGSNDNTWRGPITFTINPNFSPQTNPGSRVAIGSDDSGIAGVVDTLNLDTNIQQDSTLTSFGLIKLGAGRLNLMQANSFTGTTEVGVNIGGRDFLGGSLRIENPNSLGPNASSNSVQTLSVVGITAALGYQLAFQGRTTGFLSSTSSAATVQNALNALSSIAQSEQQQIQATGAGTYSLTFDGQTTGPLNPTDSPAAVQAALNALTSIRRSEVQEILVSGNPASGTNGFFTLTFNGQTTPPIAYNASALAVETALNALSSIFPGSVAVTSIAVPPFATKYTVTFGTTLAFANQPQIAAATFVEATTQDGSSGASEIQTVAVFSNTGTFTLSFNGLTTIPLPFNATALQVQTALKNLPSIGGVGGNVVVTSAGFGGGTQYTIQFGGTLVNLDVPQITADGAGGPVAAVTTFTQGLGGSVTVFGAAPNYTVLFQGDLASRDVSQITATSVSGTANATIVTARHGAGVLVTETPSVNGKLLTVTFQRSLDLAVVPQIQAVNVSPGLAVTAATVQQGGAGAIVNNGAGGSSLELAGDPTNTGSGTIDVAKVLTINGTGVVGQVNVTSVPVVGGTAFTLTFDGALGNTNISLVTAAGAGGTTTIVSSVQDGSRTGPDIQRVQVLGTSGTFTISLNGAKSADLAFNATAADVQAALNALTSIGGTAGALNNVNGNNIYSGAVTLGSNSSIGVNPGTTLTVPVFRDPTPLTAPAPTFTKVGEGTLVFPNANQYGGKTLVRDGVLSIQNPQAIGTGRTEVQTFTTVGTVGAFTLTFNGQTTVPLVFNIPASGGVNPNNSVQNALNALSSVRRSEVQTVRLSGSNAGTFTLTFNGQTTTAIAYNASAATVQSAFQALTSVGAGNAIVTGASPFYTITFSGALANKDLPLISATGSPTGVTNAVAAIVQDGLGGTATVTSVQVPGGRQYTVTFGGDLTNINLPQIVATSGMVFVTTTTNGSTSPPVSEVQSVETFVSGAQNFSLTFNGFSTGALAAGAPAATVKAALEGLQSVRHNEMQDVTVLGTSGTFQLTVTTASGTQLTGDLAFNISAAALQTTLENLVNVGVGNVIVTSNAIVGGTVYRVTFTGALANTNIAPMSVTGKAGASPSVLTTQDGLGGNVNVILTGVPGDFVYTVTFGGDLANTDVPQMTGASNTTASFIGGSTIADGNGSETQSVQVTGSNGTYFLTFNGQTTGPLLFSDSAAVVEQALFALTSIGGIGGTVSVTKAGTSNAPGGAVFTVNFGGSLADLNLPIMTATTTGATVVVITTANDGPEGTVVASGATLQLNGNMTMDREVVTINGLGFQNQGALNVKGGNVVWQAFSPLQQIPLFLGSNASIGTTLPTDNLRFLLPISDRGNAYNLDIFGPGTVTYASAGPALFAGATYTQYTGTTTVHDGLLLLSQPGGGSILGPLVVGDGMGGTATVRETIDNQIADTSTVLVNSDGLFDLNGHTDTISTLTVLGGTVNTGPNGQLTTGNVNMTGGTINIGDDATLTSLNVTATAAAHIVGGDRSTFDAVNVSLAGASTIAFGSNGKFNANDVLMTGNSTLAFGAGGIVNVHDIDITGGSITFLINGTLNANNVTDRGAAISFLDNGIANLANLSITNGSFAMGKFGQLHSTGNIFLDNSTLSFADDGILSATGTLTEINNAALSYLLRGSLTVGDTSLTNSTVTMGDGANATTGNIVTTNSSVSLGAGVLGGSSHLAAGNVTSTGTKGGVTFAFGDNATFDAKIVSVANGSMDFGNSGHLTATGNLSLSNTKLAFNDASSIVALDFTALLGSMVEFLLNGTVQVAKAVFGGSSLAMGDTAVVSAASYDATASALSFGNSSTVTSPGNLNLTGSSLALGTNSLLQVIDVTMKSIAAPSTISLGNGSTALLGNLNITGGSITAGNKTTVNAGNLTDLNGDITFGNTAAFNVGTASITNAKLQFGTDGTFSTAGDLALDNGIVTLGNGVVVSPQFATQNATLTNASQINLGSDTVATTLAIDMTGSQISLGTGAVLTLGGNVTATSTVANTSVIGGTGTLNVGSAPRIVNVLDGPRDVDLYVTAEVASTQTEQLIKTGAGRLELAPTTPFTGPISIQAGDVQVDTTIGQVDLTGPTASLSGNGRVGIIDGAPPIGARAIGTVSPGVNWDVNPAGILNSDSAIWGASTTFFLNIGNPSNTHPIAVAGTDYDKLQVTGNIFLNGAKLDGLFGTGVKLADKFTIIEATGFVNGRFAEPFGTGVAFINGQKFSVDYSNPQKVVLTKILANITSMSVTASLNPSTQRQKVLLTATINPEPGAGAIPFTSTVTFTFTNTVTAQTFSADVFVGAGNKAVFDTNVNLLPGNAFLPGGTYTVAATFNGDPVNFTTSSSSLASNLVVEIPVFNALTGTPGFLSPNQSPGIQDILNLAVTVNNERGKLSNWTFTIQDSSSTTVRTISSPAGLFGPSGAHTSVPISASWDGKDSTATFVPSGDYTVTASFTDEYGNTGTSNTITVVVDNLNPTATALTNSNVLIAPGVGGAVTVPGSTTFTSTVGDQAFTGHPAGTFANWSISITKVGDSVPTRTFTGTNASVNVNWNGTDAGGATIVPDAAYIVKLTATDLAGNTFSPATQTVVVLTHPPTITVTSNSPTVYGQNITITTTVSLPAGTPPSVVSLLNNNPLEFYKDSTTLLGSGNLALVGSAYMASITVPTFNAGTYNSLFVRYLGTNNFLPGDSAPITHVVTKASLTVTASQTVTKQYGDPVPALTVASGVLTVSGLVNSDTAATVLTGTATTTATQASHVIAAGYPITQGTLTSNTNYTLTFVNGKLTVTKAPLTVVVDDKTRSVHGANPPFTFTANALLLGDLASVVTGLNLTTTATVNSPVGSYPITNSGTPTAQDYNIVSVVPGTLQVTPIPTSIAIGPGQGGPSVANVYSPSGQYQQTIQAFDPAFTGGVRTATGDFNRDGVLDIAVGTGPGTTAFVRVIDGKTGADLFDVFPFENFTGGVFVTSGDINGDGADELVITPDQGGGPRVIAYSGITFQPLISYFGINDPNFRGGARAAVGDINGDGFADVAVSAGFQGGPRISIWDGKSLTAKAFKNITPDFFAFDPSLRNGAFVAIGDVNGDGKADLIAGAGPGGAPHVKIFSGADILNPAIGPANAVPFANFFAGDSNNRGGVRVAVKSLDNDLKADLITGVGDNAGSLATTYLGADLANGVVNPFFDLDAFPGFTNGVYVG